MTTTTPAAPFVATFTVCPECGQTLISDTSCVLLACPTCPRQPIARKQGDGWFLDVRGLVQGPYPTADDARVQGPLDADE